MEWATFLSHHHKRSINAGSHNSLSINCKPMTEITLSELIHDLRIAKERAEEQNRDKQLSSFSFRNVPAPSLLLSSTFHSIPFLLSSLSFSYFGTVRGHGLATARQVSGPPPRSLEGVSALLLEGVWNRAGDPQLSRRSFTFNFVKGYLKFEDG